MTRETKVGLLMVVMLVGVFGFMVYKKIHRPAEAMAEQNQGASAEQAGDEALSAPDEATNLAQSNQEPQRVITAAASTPQPIRSTSSPRAAAPVDEDPFEVTARPASTSKPKLPTTIPDDDAFLEARAASSPSIEKTASASPSPAPQADFDPFADEVKTTTPAKVVENRANPRIETAAQTEPDPFEAPLEVTSPAPASKTASTVEPDPFDAPTTGTTQVEAAPKLTPPPAQPAEVQQEAFQAIEEPRQTAPVMKAPAFEPAQQDEFNTSPTPPSVSETQVEDDRLGGFKPVEVNNRAMNEFTREERSAATAIPASDPFGAARRPAPAARIDEDFAPRTTAQALVPGDTYNIEPSDNFWIISRKKYGTGRYFMALSQHNLQVIPDPKRMKPGVTISTPSAEVLDRTYPTLIPKAAPAETAPALGDATNKAVVRRTDTESNDEAGFFLANDGTPMYRVGSEDTLSGIAKEHLGRSSRWVQIFEMNRDTLTDGNTLKVGTVLRLPGDASRVDVVGAPRQIR